MESNLKNKILNTIYKNNLIQNGDKLVLGVSGGPDSISMLDILNDINNDVEINLFFTIIVVHINHMFREEAGEDEKYVKEFCEKKGIEFYSKRIDVKKIANTNKIGSEEAGRKIRYEFFNEILIKTNSNKVAIAHNKNDKIETIFMNVLRGSGISGLKGIKYKRELYIRPLLDCKREEIELYCEEKNLKPKIDKTNSENIYTRNKVRNVVIPYIQKEFNPNIFETIDRLSKLVIEEDEYIEKQVIENYEKILVEKKINTVIIDLKEFNKNEKVIKSRIIRYIITELFGSSQSIEKIHIEDIIKLCNNNIGNKYLTPNKNLKILIKDKKINFIKKN